MGWRSVSRLVAAAGLASSVLAQQFGTTVLVYPESCSAPPTTIINTPTTSSPTATPLANPFLVVVNFNGALPKRDEFLYLSEDGSITTNPTLGAQFEVENGQLRSKIGYVSTSGLVSAQVFAASPIFLPQSRLFFIGRDDKLRWSNELFFGGQARFCVRRTTLNVFFTESPPEACDIVELVTVDADQVLQPTGVTSTLSTTVVSGTTIVEPGTYTPTFPFTSFGTPTTSVTGVPEPSEATTVIGQTAVADAVGCFYSDPNDLAIPGPGFSVSDLEQCVAYCAGFASSGISYAYVGVQFGNKCYCGNEILSTSLGSCDAVCEGNPGNFCGGSDAMSVFEIVSRSPTTPVTDPNPTSTTGAAGNPSVTISPTRGFDYPAPTSTGTPTCQNKPAFDGTVNGVYLILCDTALTGTDLTSYNTADLASCIQQCSSFPPESGKPCVAVEYYPNEPNNQCRLKATIGPVRRGGNSLAQAAILVNVPDAPTITFVDGPNPTTPNLPIASSASSPSTMTRLLSTASSTSIVRPTIIPTSNAASSASTSSGSTAPPLPPVSSFTTTTTTSRTTVVPTPTNSALCPTYDKDVLNVNNDGYNYEIQCNNDVQGFGLLDNSTRAATFQDCISQCTLYNVALPFRCVGIKYLFQQAANLNNCLLLSSVTGSNCQTFAHAARLIYGGYPSPTGVACGPRSTTSALNPAASSSSSSSSPPPPPATSNLISSSSTSPRSASTSTVAATSSTSSPVSPPPSQQTTVGTVAPTIAVSSTSIAGPNSQATSGSSTAFIRPSGSSSSSSTFAPPVPSSSNSTATITRLASVSSTITTARAVIPSSSTTTTSPRPAYTAPPCSSPPNETVTGQNYPDECITNQVSPVCHSYYFDFDEQIAVRPGGYANYEIECNTIFSGSRLDAIGTQLIDLRDCIRFCDYQNRMRPEPICLGVSFLGEDIAGQAFGTNNCFSFTSLGCATRGNASVQSARLLWAGYPEMVDYDPSFNC